MQRQMPCAISSTGCPSASTTETAFREFTAQTLAEATINALRAFHADLADLDIRVLRDGSPELCGDDEEACIRVRRLMP